MANMHSRSWCRWWLSKMQKHIILSVVHNCDATVMWLQRRYACNGTATTLWRPCNVLRRRCDFNKTCQLPSDVIILSYFYRTMLCIRGTSHGPVSVTSRCSTKTAKSRITQTTPHDSPGNPVFWSQKSPRNSTRVTPYGGAKCRWGGSKWATFDK